MKLFPRNSTSAGFTLLEVMIAMTIMVLCMASIFQISSTSIGAVEKVKNFNLIASMARNKMQETEFEIEGKSFTDMTKEESGTFEGPDFQDFRWQREIKEVEFPNLASLGKAQGGEGEDSGGSPSSGGGNSDIAGMIGKNVTDYLSKSVREITITIFWKRAGGELKYSLSTYWVDLNHEFSITQ